MGTPGPTRAALRHLRRISLTVGVVAGIAVLPVPVQAGQAGDAPAPVSAESPSPTDGPPAPAAPVVPAPAPIRILPLGDSLTRGVGSSDGSGYRAPLHHALTAAGRTVDFVGSQRSGAAPDRDHEGHPGWRIDQVDARLARWIAAADPDVVLVDLGTNDYVQNHDVARAPARVAALVDRIAVLAPDAHVVLAKLLVIAGDRRAAQVREFNAAVPRIVAARRARVSMADMSRIPVANTVDGVHPTDIGYRQMAYQWLRALRPALADGRAWPRATDPFPMPAIRATVTRTAATITVTARLSGRLTPVDLGGVLVRLRFRPAGSSAWTSLGTARTDARGEVHVRRRTATGGHVTAVVVTGRAAGRVSPAARVRPPA